MKLSDSIAPGVVTGKDVQKIFETAKAEEWALPAVNAVGTDSINAVMEAAAKVHSPVIVQFSHGARPSMPAKGSPVSVRRSWGASSGAKARPITLAGGPYGESPGILQTGINGRPGRWVPLGSDGSPWEGQEKH